MRPEQETELRAKLISGAKWATVVRFASQAFSWVITLIMVRLLTPADYGLNAMIEVPIELLMLFSTLGMDAAIIRFGKRDAEQLASTFGLLLLLNMLFFLILLLSAGMIADYFKEPRLTALIQVTALVFVLAPFRIIPNALLDMDLDFKLKAQVELVGSVVSSLIALLLALAGAGVWALVASIVVGTVFRAVPLMYLRPWIVRPVLRIGPVRELLNYGMVIMAGGAIGVISAKALSLLAGPHLGVEVLGFYAVASVLAMLPMSKVMPILQQTMFPAFAQLKEQPATARKYLLKSLELSALIIFPLTIGMACVSEHLVTVVFGDKWSAISLPLAILAALSPLRLVNQIFHGPLNAIGHAKSVTSINLITLAVLAGGALYAASYGLMGLIYLTGLSVLIATSVSVAVGRKVFGTTPLDLIKSVTPALVASLAMATVLVTSKYLITDQSGLIHLLVEVVVGGSIYFLVIWLFFRARFDEIKKHLK
jgi:O-antigen/teichoic acid export membrane protein